MIETIKDYVKDRKLIKELLISYGVFLLFYIFCMRADNCEQAGSAGMVMILASICYLFFFITMFIKSAKMILFGPKDNKSTSFKSLIIKFLLFVFAIISILGLGTFLFRINYLTMEDFDNAAYLFIDTDYFLTDFFVFVILWSYIFVFLFVIYFFILLILKVMKFFTTFITQKINNKSINH
ncbi:hypothetical protein [Gilliamella sp. GillExp13]|uniref:hypothetical protein n=1 Tax=Gilliamella sp. GillExp13 TaxID=3120243 RepID=UPI00080DE36E|nr:hypothetical protein [Gilliamella apicola]OCG63896.1 hypothetical protein A9G37_08165 [Gilliamella apicola]